MITEPTPSTPPLPELLDRVLRAVGPLQDALTALSGARRALIAADPSSPWHALAEHAVLGLHDRLYRASQVAPLLSTRAVAQMGGLSPATVSAACAAGELPALRTDAGCYLIDASDARMWIQRR